MGKRKIINIDRVKCTGCGLCIPNCPEGALRIIDGKATLVSDLFCDGLGACIGHCPEGAISIEERQAEPYSEKKVMANIVKQGGNVIKAHLEHLKDHHQERYLKEAVEYLRGKHIKNPPEPESESPKKPLPCGCPGTNVVDLREQKSNGGKESSAIRQESELRQWPVQIMLVPVSAPYFDGADLLIAADCTAFAYGGFHANLLKGKILLVGCPKLDDAPYYKEKITDILKNNSIKSITCVHMEVPCCFGLVNIVKEALAASGKNISYKEITISIKGEVKLP